MHALFAMAGLLSLLDFDIRLVESPLPSPCQKEPGVAAAAAAKPSARARVEELVDLTGRGQISMVETLELQRLLAALNAEDVVPLLQHIRKLMEAKQGPAVLMAADLIMARLWLVSRWAELDGAKALEWILAHPPADEEDDHTEAAAVFAVLASTSPEAAAKALASLPTDDYREEMRGTVAQILGRKDPQSALRWLKTNGDDGAAAGEFLTDMAESDPARAAGALGGTDVPAGVKTDAALARRIAGEWVRKDPEAAGKWIAGMNDKELRTACQIEFWKVRQENNRDGVAADFLKWVKADADGAAGNEDAVTLATTLTHGWWNQGAGEKSIQFTASLPAGKIRDAALTNCIQNQADNDPTAAATRMETLPAGAVRDEGLRSLSESLAESAPQKALAAAKKIQDEETRRGALAGVFRKWLLAAPRSAIKALEALPDNDRKEVETQLPE